MLTLALLTGYAATQAFALHHLAAARHREEALLAAQPTSAEWNGYTEAAAVPPGAVAGHPALERLAADVHETLDVDCVAVG